MGNSIPNLKAVADYFGITNKALAKAINVDQIGCKPLDDREASTQGSSG